VSRGVLVLALLVSLGVNVGLVGVGLARRAGVERWERSRESLEAPRPGFGLRLADRLGVPAERRERFLAVQRRLAERTGAERREVLRVRLELRRELLAREPDRARLDELLAELAAREAELSRALVAGVLESREVLSGRELELYLRFLERAAPGHGSPRRGGRLHRAPPP
jgi:hypothetical protein